MATVTISTYIYSIVFLSPCRPATPDYRKSYQIVASTPDNLQNPVGQFTLVATGKITHRKSDNRLLEIGQGKIDRVLKTGYHSGVIIC